MENPCNNAQRAYRIGGISVEFPYKAYSSQLAFMGKVVATLERSHKDPINRSSGNNNTRCHALLESPTGTGKSLALLCSTLAWLKHFKASSRSLPPPRVSAAPAHGAFPDSIPAGVAFVPETGSGLVTGDVLTGGGFVLETPATGGGFVPEEFSTGGGFLPENVATTEERPTNGSKQTSKKPKLPTIFYATRTHSQITQVLREYRKTSYRVPMAVLAARKHYCTNKHVCKRKNIDEECKLLLKDPDRSCLQFKNFHKVKNHASLQKGGAHEIFDIEDLVGVGNSVKGCAYFAARSMALDAQIVFCPYGYLLNPVIRKAMEINLQGAIVILDEAHNIEDVAREAGSIDLEISTLEGMRMELEQLSALGPAAEFYHPLLDMVQEMLSWIYQKSNCLEKQDFERYSSCWLGEGALQELESVGISSQSFPMLLECAKKAIGTAADAEANSSHLSGFSVGILEGLFSVLNYMLKDDGNHLLDYRVVVQKYVKRDEELGVTGWVSSLSFWCLNPAVVFEEVASNAQSIILTSGTLSPLGSFASELGVPFEVCMEAPHVIDMKSQVWAASVSKGPGNVPLNASYKHADGYAFQDALGSALEEIFKVSPDGALVFFPSYKLLEKLCDRWKATGQWKRLYEEKQLFTEPRGKLETFETMLVDYYRAVNGKPKTIAQKSKSRVGTKKNAKDPLTDSCTKRRSKSGAAFLAVCRGKVSEGIDFSDKNARVVIVVGIPFPNQKDLQVNMKKQYNSQNKVSKNLLSGDQWYCYQAFRALNQAVGRCIRHSHDYGAIILLDERYKKASNLDYMSKWLRSSIQQVESLQDSLKGLQSFFQKFKDTSHQHISSIKAATTNDVENNIYLSNSTLAQATVTSPAKQRFLKHSQSAKAPRTSNKFSFPVCDNHAKERMTDLHSNKAECDQGCSPQQHRSPLQEILPQTRANLKSGPAQSGSVVTLLESPTMASQWSLAGGLGSGAGEASSTKRHDLDCQQQWTPIASTLSNTPEVNGSTILKAPSSSYENTGTECLLNEQIPVIPCNLFGKSSERVFVSAAGTSTLQSGPSSDPLVRSLSSDFMACEESSLNNTDNIDGFKLDCNLSAGKKLSTQVEASSEEHNTITGTVLEEHVGTETSILCARCGRSLLRAPNHGNLQKVRLKKKFLQGLMDSLKACRASQPADHTNLLVYEMSLLHPHVDVSTVNMNHVNQSSQGIWVEEDGCVFKPLFCPWCKCEHCIGAHVLAANRMNMDLVDMALLLSDSLMVSDGRPGRCVPGTQSQETRAYEEKWIGPSSNFPAKRGNQTPPRTKLKLPRRD